MSPTWWANRAACDWINSNRGHGSSCWSGHGSIAYACNRTKIIIVNREHLTAGSGEARKAFRNYFATEMPLAINGRLQQRSFPIPIRRIFLERKSNAENRGNSSHEMLLAMYVAKSGFQFAFGSSYT